MFLTMNKKVHIATSRPIGGRCIKYAKANMPLGYELCENTQDSDVLICVMYDTILKEDFINKRRCYNFHGGLLPDYRGVGIFSWAIINGEEETGITLHELDSGLDTGPIISCKKFPITKESTAHSLYLEGMEALFDLFKEYFTKLITGDYKAKVVKKKPNSLYTRKMLDEVRDITRLMRAVYFPEKEGLYYYNPEGNRTIIRHD
jgi:methionyl-tRNA formyltransferase